MKLRLLLFVWPLISFGQLSWVPLSQEVNFYVENLNTYNNQLVAGGHFTTAGSTQANCIAAWNGSVWSTFGKGIRGSLSPYVFETIIHNNELFAVGKFDSAGTVLSKNVAKWNGSNWVSLSSSCNNPIFAIAVYNNEVYCSGAFTIINGVPAKRIAKWDGSSWQAVGAGFVLAGAVNDLCVYQNELYAVGNFDSVGNIKCNNIARWNGTSWNTVSNGFNSPSAAMIVWQGKLLIEAGNLFQWDGSTLSPFPWPGFAVRKFYIFNNTLYCSGMGGSNNIAVWDNSTNTWNTFGSGINNLTPAIVDFSGELYCGGRFNVSNGGAANYIAKWGIGTKLNNHISDVSIEVFPNPTKDHIYIKLKGTENNFVSYFIYDNLGQLLKTGIINTNTYSQVNLSDFRNGPYFLNVKIGGKSHVYKVIKID